jgi:hypothetical protein
MATKVRQETKHVGQPWFIRQVDAVRRVAFVPFIFLAALTSAHAAVLEIHEGDSFEAAVENLNPGDRLIVHQGTYEDSGRISITVKGTPSAPVVIEGADGESRPHITRPASAQAQNTINIEGATHLTIRDLEISSNGGDGINLNSRPSHITLEDLHIHDIDVGINFRSDMDHITVRKVHIHNTGQDGGTGEGMYVGCNYAACAVTNSIIEGNWIHHTQQSAQGDGIEIKRGSHSITVRDNVIHDTKYPCILVYGTEGNPRNLIEGNVMWNCGDSGIQAAADAVIRNNIILATTADGLNSQDHQGVTPNNLEFIHNTIVGGNPCLRLSNWNNKQGIVFANNAVYCDSGNYQISGLTGVVTMGNVFSPSPPSFPATAYVLGRSSTLDLVDAAGRDVYPTADSALIDVGASAYVTPVDFNGTGRSGQPDAGAYTWTTPENPGWPIGAGFKQLGPAAVRPSPPRDLRVR